MPEQVENLEPRCYLSASLDSSTKLLTITGTNNGDRIRVSIGGLKLHVAVNGFVTNFPVKSVGSVLIDALGGNDNVEIFNSVKIASTLLGSTGNDTLYGGGGNDVLDGGAGSDNMYGGLGSDLVDYSSRTAPVTVTIGGGPTSGETGEHDNVHYDIEEIAGGSGDDSLTGTGSNHTLFGNGGNDTLKSGSGNDLLDGGNGNDLLYGQAGNDTLRGGSGNDEFFGGLGSDWADYSDHDTLSPDPANMVQITNDDDPTDGLYVNGVEVEFDDVHSDVENIIGTNGNDLIGGFGNVPHILEGRGGDDLMLGGDAADSIDGGVGNDTLIGAGGNDTLIGGPDTIAAGESDNDNLEGDAGDDSLRGGAGNDTAFGIAGNDTVAGGRGDDVLSGDVGNDSLLGGDGNDTITGGVDNDTIDGGAGIDSLSGGDGDDVVTDPGTVLPQDDSLSADAAALDAIDTLDGGTGQDSISGGDGSAFIFGGDGNDTVMGGNGDEQIDLGLGDDSCDAGGGNDVINGDFGNDTLDGGDGNDIFINAEGQSDSIDGGDGIDLTQFEPTGVDTVVNAEGLYDQPVDDGELPPPPFPEDDSIAALGAIATSSGPLTAAPVSPVVVVKGILEITGQVDVHGAPVDDKISLSQSGSTITVLENGTNYPVPIAGLKGILINGASGNDSIALASSSGKSTINLPATVLGGKGNDTLLGGDGSDSLIGGLGNDSLAGNAGNDFLNGGLEAANSDADGTDTLMGGAGEDAAVYTYRTTPLTLSLDGVAHSGAAGEKDVIGADVEDVFGGRGNDSITGNAARNVLSGGTGSDTLRGGAGNDVLIGSCHGDSGDLLFGDAGTDSLIMAGDHQADQYDLGANGGFVSRDVAPDGNTFLDNPI